MNTTIKEEVSIFKRNRDRIMKNLKLQRSNEVNEEIRYLYADTAISEVK